MSKSKVDAVEPVTAEVDAVEPVTAAVKSKKGDATFIRAVYGRMVDPHTGLSYDVVPSELLKMTGWVQSQIDDGKLVIV